MKRMKPSVVTRPGGIGHKKCFQKELKISFRHREITSTSTFSSLSPHWMLVFPHIRLSPVLILPFQSLHAPRLALLLLGKEPEADSSPSSYHDYICRCGLMPVYLFLWIYEVSGFGLQFLKLYLCTLLPRLLLFLLSWRTSASLNFPVPGNHWRLFFLAIHTQKIIEFSQTTPKTLSVLQDLAKAPFLGEGAPLLN